MKTQIRNTLSEPDLADAFTKHRSTTHINLVVVMTECGKEWSNQGEEEITTEDGNGRRVKRRRNRKALNCGDELPGDMARSTVL
jgi:hypothetical protein